MISILSLIRLLIFKTLSLHITSFSPTENLDPLNWQYWSSLLSIELLWKRAVNANIKPWDKRSIKDVWPKRVLCMAEDVWAERENFSQCFILLFSHLLSHAAISRKNPGLLSFWTAALKYNYQNNTNLLNLTMSIKN